MPGHVDGFLWKGNLNDLSLPEPVKFKLVYNGTANKFELNRVN